MVEAAGVELFRPPENTQLTDSTRRQNRQNSHNRSTEVHGGYTALFFAALVAPETLPALPFQDIFGMLRTVALVGGLLWIVIVPAVINSYESWKRKQRVR